MIAPSERDPRGLSLPKPSDGLSCAIIAYNEEANIARAVESVLWADEIVVVDCGSTDSTRAILRLYDGVRVLESVNNPNLDVNKNLAIDACSSSWILVLDADEVVSDELRRSILTILGDGTDSAGFYVLRINHFLNRPLKYSMNHPDYVLRLFRKGIGRFPAVHVHEELTLDGVAGRLKGPLLHYSYPTIEAYIRKVNFYTSFEASSTNRTQPQGIGLPIRERVRQFYWRWVPLKPLARFIVKYFLRLGFLDGKWGFHYCVLSAFSDYVVELKRRANSAAVPQGEPSRRGGDDGLEGC